MQAATRKPIAFLFPAFPVLHQTFVLWEVLALRERGIPLALYSIKRPGTRTQQPEGAALAHEVRYLPGTFSPTVVRANIEALARSPVRYLKTFPRLIRAWWHDRDVGNDWRNRRVSGAAPDRERTFTEKWQGRYNRSPLLYLLKSLWLVPRAVYLGNHLQSQGIERIHAHWASYSTTMALVIHWIFGLRFSFSAHAYDIYLVPRFLRVKVAKADFVVTCARVNGNFLASLNGPGQSAKIVVNYHGVDLRRFQPRATSGAPSRTPCILACGRLEPYKGHHVLLRACAALSRPARCVIVGEGPQRDRLRQMACELKIDARVEFPGPIPQAELVRRYAQADVFVLASVVLERSGKRDVIPNVLAEAMAMEVPVVASDISGVSELIDDKISGRLVPPNDERELARVLDELLGDEAQRQRLGRAGRHKVATDFDRAKNIEGLVALFESEARQAGARER